MANSKAAGPVKVVFIEYHHIQTDVSNFKSVVQTLTGMNSTAGGNTRKKPRVDENIIDVRSARFEESTVSCETDTTSSVQSTSFEDLDPLLLKLELPSMEDLNWIWAD
ncbi:VQ motif-containing protein 10 [Cucurbita maxima]|uniref:VQ motif-containing protein 10 n=1 Tax=Cucurbita maxima TaxID=3661 RepID=A0A6J1KT83_CUCMA|nr:VQ motif-containing protein 10 [Cucurbita maxima]